MPGAAEIHVKGLRELQLALKRIESDVGKELRKALRDAAEPVRLLAADKARSRIRNIGPRWSEMRVGVTSRSVYVAPKARRRGGSPRGNLAVLLIDEAMQPALDESKAEVYGRVESMLDRLGDKAGF